MSRRKEALKHGDIFSHLGMVWLYLGKGNKIKPVTINEKFATDNLCLLICRGDTTQYWHNGELYTTTGGTEYNEIFGNIYSMLDNTRRKIRKEVHDE